MNRLALEFGTFYLSEAASDPPPVAACRDKAVFGELSPADAPALQRAMHLPDPEPVLRRFATGRRCFGLRSADEIVAYGWATRGPESVGELEREFSLNTDEIYIWDCATLPTWRGQGCYPTLLHHMRCQLHQEGLPRLWIGAGINNRASVQGIARAGFQHIMDMGYRRLGPVTVLWFRKSPAATNAQATAAYRVLMTRSERRWGPLGLGTYPA